MDQLIGSERERRRKRRQAGEGGGGAAVAAAAAAAKESQQQGERRAKQDRSQRERREMARGGKEESAIGAPAAAAAACEREKRVVGGGALLRGGGGRTTTWRRRRTSVLLRGPAPSATVEPELEADERAAADASRSLAGQDWTASWKGSGEGEGGKVLVGAELVVSNENCPNSSSSGSGRSSSNSNRSIGQRQPVAIFGSAHLEANQYLYKKDEEKEEELERTKLDRRQALAAAASQRPASAQLAVARVQRGLRPRPSRRQWGKREGACPGGLLATILFALLVYELGFELLARSSSSSNQSTMSLI